MENITRKAEAALLKRQTLPAQYGQALVRPAYDGLSLPNAAAQALQWLAPDAGAPAGTYTVPPIQPGLLNEPELNVAWENWQKQGPINHVVMLLMDALGYDQLQTMMEQGVASNLARAVQREQAFFMPITSVQPSTTTTALTSAATAHAPAHHGIMGTWVYMSEIGSIVDLIGYRPAVAPTLASYLESQLDPDTLVPVPNLYKRFEEAGVQAEIVNFHQFKGSSISRFTSAGSLAGRTFYNSYLTPADGFSQLRERLATNRQNNRKSFTYAYVSYIDTTAHRYGPLSPNYQAELATLDFTIQRQLIEGLAGQSDVVLLLVADHGQRWVETDKVLWLNDHPQLIQHLMVPQTGESRTSFLHLKHGSEEFVRGYVEQNFGEKFLVISQAEAVELGLFGQMGQPLGPECANRVGDLILIAKGAWVARQNIANAEKVYPTKGVHGGLSREEMLIPFLAYRF